jgi:hypothetical protein
MQFCQAVDIRRMKQNKSINSLNSLVKLVFLVKKLLEVRPNNNVDQHLLPLLNDEQPLVVMLHHSKHLELEHHLQLSQGHQQVLQLPSDR